MGDRLSKCKTCKYYIMYLCMLNIPEKEKSVCMRHEPKKWGRVNDKKTK